MSLGVTILGSTGSIGKNTLSLISQHPDLFHVTALTAHKNVDLLYNQCLHFKPHYAVIVDPTYAKKLEGQLRQANNSAQLLVGSEALNYVASLKETDVVMASIVGAAGLLPTLAAIRAKKKILLANKEALVMAGELFMHAVHEHEVTLIPVDSEHNAIFQCLPQPYVIGKEPQGFSKIILTASGGSIRDLPLETLENLTPSQACQHPNWVMGQKITVDSATMMNKGFEVIEAHWLFGIPAEKIEILLHPQSIVHSLVQFRDNSLLAQLGSPDMRIPISYALGFPQRLTNQAPVLNLITASPLSFFPVDKNRYPAVDLAYQAIAAKGTAATILNAANEVTVQAFLEKRIGFTMISSINELVLSKVPIQISSSLQIILEADELAREVANSMIKNFG